MWVDDRPGLNTAFRPDSAPAWFRPLIDAARAGTFARSPLARPRGTTRSDVRAAVLVLLAGDPEASSLPEDATVLLTHRSATMRSHSGQLAFPGGRVDPGDNGVVDAALREAWEETGLDRRGVLPVTELGQMYVRRSGYPVHPIVGYWRERSRVGVVSPDEADEVFEARLADLADPENRITVGWEKWTGPAFRNNGYLLWGFTAGVVHAVLRLGGWESPWDRERVYDLGDALSRSRNNERATR